MGTSRDCPVAPVTSRDVQLAPDAAKGPTALKISGVGKEGVYAHPTHFAESSSIEMLLVSR